jgi:hypothetical protein
MQLKAKLIECLPLQTGTSKNGEWKKQDIIVETDAQYPKKICISIWGDKINNEILQLGRELIVDFDIESRAYNNRWYTDIKAWKIESVQNAIEDIQKISQQASLDQNQLEEEDDDLPF